MRSKKNHNGFEQVYEVMVVIDPHTCSEKVVLKPLSELELKLSSDSKLLLPSRLCRLAGDVFSVSDVKTEFEIIDSLKPGMKSRFDVNGVSFEGVLLYNRPVIYNQVPCLRFSVGLETAYTPLDVYVSLDVNFFELKKLGFPENSVRIMQEILHL